jgi:hypothetical protein
LNVNQHSAAVDVGDLQMAQLRVPHAGRVQDHQHRAVGQTVRGVDQPRHLLAAQEISDSRREALGYGVSSSWYRHFSGRIFRSRSRYAWYDWNCV